jgi:hypothetical protein
MHPRAASAFLLSVAVLVTCAAALPSEASARPNQQTHATPQPPPSAPKAPTSDTTPRTHATLDVIPGDTYVETEFATPSCGGSTTIPLPESVDPTTWHGDKVIVPIDQADSLPPDPGPGAPTEIRKAWKRFTTHPITYVIPECVSTDESNGPAVFSAPAQISSRPAPVGNTPRPLLVSAQGIYQPLRSRFAGWGPLLRPLAAGDP